MLSASVGASVAASTAAFLVAATLAATVDCSDVGTMRFLLATGYAIMALSMVVMWLQYARQSAARVHVQPSIFTAAECASAVRIAERADVWVEKRHDLYPTDDFSVDDVPELANVSRAVDARVLPFLREAFGVRDDLELRVDDLFFIRYTAAGQSGLKMHGDSTTLSFSLALSESHAYTGGGIQFELLEETIRVTQGTVVMHPSKLQHKGADVLSGTRYVLVGFVSVGDDELLTYGTSEPGSAELLHGMWATCVQVMAPREEGRLAGVAGGDLPTSMTEERCISVREALARQLFVKAGALKEGLTSAASGEGMGDDAYQLLVLNACLLLGSIVFLRMVG